MKYTQGKELKSGAEGKIFEIQESKDLVLKLFNEKDLKGDPIVTKELQQKVEYMKDHPPFALLNNGNIAWPIELLYANGKLTGFVMPFFHNFSKIEDLYIYRHPLIDKNYGELPTIQSRIGIAINLAATVSEIHKAGFIIGDMNQKNIGIDRNTAKIQIVDCDSFTITTDSGTTLRTNVCMPGFLAPEIISHCKSERTKGQPYNLDEVVLPTFTKESDLFCLAIHIFRLLMNGVHPFLGVKANVRGSFASPFTGNQGVERNNYVFKTGLRPSAIFCPYEKEIPLNIKTLFDRAFLVGNSDPKKRPSAEEWYFALLDYLKSLKQCSNNSNHQYFNQLSKCPFCEADKRHYEIQYGNPQPTGVFKSKPIPKSITNIISKNFGSPNNITNNKFCPIKQKWKRIIIGITFAVIISLVINVCLTYNKNSKIPNEQETVELHNTLSKTNTQSNSSEMKISSLQKNAKETFSTSKYVHTAGLTVRSGPGTEFSSLFIIPQNTLVKLSDSSRKNGWVKIQHNQKIGWVNGTFLRDFLIINIQIGNHDDQGYWITKPGEDIYSYQLEHLGIYFNSIVLNGYNENTTLYVKITNLNTNKYIKGNNNVLSGYSTEFTVKMQSGSRGIGTYDIRSHHYYKGDWLVQIYYQNPKNFYTMDCIGSRKIHIY